MSAGEDQASLWTRLFRCTSVESVEEELGASRLSRPESDSARAAWRAHRAALDRAEARLDARARDLDALQTFGRDLAHARTVPEILDRTAGTLQSLVDADAVAIASAITDTFGVRVYLARPLSPEDEQRLREAVASGFIPLSAETEPARPLVAFDRLQGTRAPLVETDIVVVPVERRGRELLRVAVVARLGPSERGLRVLFGATNHLAIHVDRVLAVADAEQGRFRAILDSMPHAVVLTDASFQVVHANVSAERLFPRLGSGAASALRSVGDLDLAALAYDVLTGRRAGSEGESRLPDGGFLEVAVAPWRDGTGRADGLVVVMLDVTTARRLRDQVTQSEKLSSLGRMIAGVAHELNNPLTAVIGYAQLLRTMPPGEKASARLDTVRKEAERCRRIVQNLLRFARAHQPEKKPFSLNEVAENVVQLLAYPVRSSGCRTVLELTRTVPAVVGDAHEVEQALVNLVTNAQQAMVSAGRPGAITIRTYTAADGRVGLEVADEGPGIGEELRAKVFDPFFTTKPAGQGTGLGLWLVYNTVMAHGGTVELGASDGGGAAFRLEFPLGGTSAVKPEVVEEELDDSPRVSARILVLDAEAALAALICEALAAEGHLAVAAHDANEALLRLSGEPFDLLVSDAALPGLPGERLALEVERLRPEIRHRILLTTDDWDSREPEAIARHLGAGLLRKPFELDELRRVVRTRLNRDPEH
jgi:signal transduction histidine kinase/CheY-like chemotaxis protein